MCKSKEIKIINHKDKMAVLKIIRYEYSKHYVYSSNIKAQSEEDIVSTEDLKLRKKIVDIIIEKLRDKKERKFFKVDLLNRDSINAIIGELYMLKYIEQTTITPEFPLRLTKGGFEYIGKLEKEIEEKSKDTWKRIIEVSLPIIILILGTLLGLIINKGS